MISLSMASLLGTDVGQEPGDDQLQADVMRFMAIIGFCLVAIFAVVQSIPLLKPPAVAEKPVVEHRQLAELRRQLVQLTAQRQQATAEVADLTRQSQQLQQAIADQERRLVKQRIELAVLQQRQATAAAVVSETPKSPPRPAAVEAVEPPPDKARLQETLREPQPASAPEAPADAPGFSLTVVSDPVLLALLQQQRLTLYVLHNGQARHIAPAGGIFRVVDAALPRRYHEMRRRTVPPVLRTLVSQYLPAAEPDSLVWALVLPGDMQRQLQRLMETHDSGQLIIGARGRIRHQAE